MKVIFLGSGTSQGVPVIACACEVCTSIDHRDKRLRSSIYFECDNFKLIVDTGPDFRQQVLSARITELDAILFTHAHKDHTAGMDDIRSFNFHQKKEMPVYGQILALDQIKKEFAYIFSENKYPGIPQVNLNPIENQPFEINGKVIIPIEVMHHKLPVFGYRIDDFTYITDANFIAEEEKEKIEGTKVLVFNALQKREHISHFTLDQALKLIEELKPEKAFLTHIGHQLGLHSEVAKELPENVNLAYDGLSIVIDND